MLAKIWTSLIMNFLQTWYLCRYHHHKPLRIADAWQALHVQMADVLFW